MPLSLCSMEEPLVLDEVDLVLKLDGLRLLLSERHVPAPGGVRQADRNAARGLVTLCSSADPSR